MKEIKRIPRKIKKQIPVGLYCYTGIKFDMNTGIYHVKPCGSYSSVPDKEYPDSHIGWCKILKVEIDDQCKSCNSRIGF